jgi:hypothetical protein
VRLIAVIAFSLAVIAFLVAGRRSERIRWLGRPARVTPQGVVIAVMLIAGFVLLVHYL